MEDILQVFGDMMECGPLSFQAPPPSSYESVSFDSRRIAISSVFDTIEQFELLKGNKGDSQCPSGLGCPNRLEKIEQGWQRIKWTDEMVKVLIAAVSFASFDGPPIKGKWRSISNTMVERGYIVSPQQCEDKFNDLNKKYKRLNLILGATTSCDVVENPTLIEVMNIPVEAKEEVRKILTCKQLFYREMHSYHNKNRRRFIQQSTSALSDVEGRVEYSSQDVILGMHAKRSGEDNGVSHDKKFSDLFNIFPEAVEDEQELSEWVILSRLVQSEEKKLQIQNQMLELEEKKFQWLKSCHQEEEELQKMKLENELMKLENERLAFELKCRQRRDARD